jgi:ABC-2 type transport system ATP-binding protein
MTPSIEARHLGKRFGPVRAVEDVGFEVIPGRVTGLLGPNGAGKTTTLRVLPGMDRGSCPFLPLALCR